MSETIQARDIEANTNEKPLNHPKVAEISDMQAVAHVQEEIRPEIPRDIITWIKDIVKEFEQDLKLVRTSQEQVKEELTEMKESREELLLEFEDTKRDNQEFISKMTNMESRIENLQELIDATNKRLTTMGTKIAENILEVEKEGELLKESEKIQQQVKDLEDGSKPTVTDILEN